MQTCWTGKLIGPRAGNPPEISPLLGARLAEGNARVAWATGRRGRGRGAPVGVAAGGGQTGRPAPGQMV